MKYRKENVAVFDYELRDGNKFGATKYRCRPSASLEEYIERELKLDGFFRNNREITGTQRAFALN